MESITRTVRDLESTDRQALEHVLGRTLSENQYVVIQVLNPDTAAPLADLGDTSPVAKLPDWCQVYEGLSDAEIADIESSIIRLPSTRTQQ